MIILGLTGSIGMGKSTAADMLRRMGVPVHDSDAAVHRLMAPGGAALPAIEAAFPGVVVDGAVDRRRLGDRVFGDPDALARLEGILHPMVTADSQRFLALQARHGRRMAALDIPLLLETGQQYRVDVLLVVSAPRFVQRARVLGRPGMTEDRFQQVLARQTPDAVKRRQADRVIPSGLGRGETWRCLASAVAAAGCLEAGCSKRGCTSAFQDRRRPNQPKAWPPSPPIRARIWGAGVGFGRTGSAATGIWLGRFMGR